MSKANSSVQKCATSVKVLWIPHATHKGETRFLCRLNNNNKEKTILCAWAAVGGVVSAEREQSSTGQGLCAGPKGSEAERATSGPW